MTNSVTFIQNDLLIGATCAAVAQHLEELGYVELESTLFQHSNGQVVPIVYRNDYMWQAYLGSDNLLSLTPNALIGILQEMEAAPVGYKSPVELAAMIQALVSTSLLPSLIQEWQ